MIDIFLISQLVTSNPETQKLCAAAVGIPYASDNFSDVEWQRFQRCLQFFERVDSASEAPRSAPRVVVPMPPSPSTHLSL
jgi:hypothetical protein